MPKPKVQTPSGIRPYKFHGVDLKYKDGDTHATADCPSCGKEGKFSVDVVEGTWRCFVCSFGSEKGGGNIYTFLRWLWTESDKRTNGQTKVFAKDRKLVFPETLTHWGACVSVLTGEWLVPGHGPDKKLNNLYRYTRDYDRPGKMKLLGTPDLPTQLFGVTGWDESKPEVYLCEGPWDGMALWEALRSTKDLDGKLEFTGNPDKSLWAVSNVLAIPGCGSVGEPLKKYAQLLSGKRVLLMFDSDHPRDHDGRAIDPPGFAAMRRAARVFTEGRDKPESIFYLDWGPDGYDPDRPSGTDVRDVLSARGEGMSARVESVRELIGMAAPVPDEWIPGRSPETARAGKTEIQTKDCRDWKTLVTAWKKAMRWRLSLDDVLSVALAVATSTLQRGDQLFLQMIGDAGSGKTRFCDGMLTSTKYCYPLEHLTGFHSGWKDNSGEDYSLLSRVNGKCMITPEGDVLMSAPNFVQIMSQQRRIFDGTSGASYKNRKEDLRYTNLRTPWIMAGTPALMDTDQSRLGDRFLRVILTPPTASDRSEILRHVGYSALRSVRQTSVDSEDGGTVDAGMLEAYRLTGGYVDYLRENIDRILDVQKFDEDALVGRCSDLAEITSFLRARPNSDPKKDDNDTTELPTRLQSQFIRLSCCLAAVLNLSVDDPEVSRRVKKVATDTGQGPTRVILAQLYPEGREGITPPVVAAHIAQETAKVSNYLRFLERIKAVEHYDRKISPRHSRTERRYRLTERTEHLYREVYGS